MGIVTDSHSRQLIYDHTKPSYTIREGIIVAKNKKVYDVCQKRVIESLGRGMAELHAEFLLESDARKKERDALLGKNDKTKHKIIKIDPKVFGIDELQSNSYPDNKI